MVELFVKSYAAEGHGDKVFCQKVGRVRVTGRRPGITSIRSVDDVG